MRTCYFLSCNRELMDLYISDACIPCMIQLAEELNTIKYDNDIDQQRILSDGVRVESITLRMLPKICVIHGCQEIPISKGLCRKHYARRWKRMNSLANKTY